MQLEEAELTLINMLSKTKKVITTPPTVLYDVASYKLFYNTTWSIETLSLLFVPPVEGGRMEINMVKTSVIVPVYNTSKYLKDCFNSIFNQTLKEIEVIAINDGSTDDSLHILEEIKKGHSNMFVYSQLNQGLGSTRNKGMELATGEYIYFMDSDDCIVSDALEVCYECAKKSNLDIVMFDAETISEGTFENTSDYNRADKISEQEVVIRGEDFAGKYWLNAFCSSSCLIYMSRDFLIRHNLKFITQVFYEDTEFCCRAIPLAERVMYIPRMLYIRRYRCNSITTSFFDINHANSYLQIIQAIDELEYSDKVQKVLHKIQLGILRALTVYSEKSNLLKNRQFCQEFYKLTLGICGGSIDKVVDYNDIKTLCQVSIFIPDEIISIETKEKIKERKKEILENMFAEIPLKFEGRYVGIYGTGNNTKRFIDEYQEYIAEIKADIIFIDSNVVLGEKKCRNYPIYNINDIKNIPLECIVIASSKYENEMYQLVRKKYENKFKIIRLSTDLHF